MGTGSYDFDPINKFIKILSGSQNPLDALDIYDKSMDWADNSGSMVYDAPMGAVGKAPLGGGVYSDSIFILQNGWKLKFYDGTYQFIIKGTIITDDETARTVSPDSGSVEAIFQVSSQGTISTDLALANDISWIKKIERGRWKIVNNQLVFYDEDNTTIIRTFNLFNKTGQPASEDIYERVPA